jgi:hypothetical protein
MKLTWEEGDIIAGLKVRPGGSSSTYMIAYTYHALVNRPNVYQHWGLVDLADGLIVIHGTVQELATYLNQGFVPVLEPGDTNTLVRLVLPTPRMKRSL